MRARSDSVTCEKVAGQESCQLSRLPPFKMTGRFIEKTGGVRSRPRSPRSEGLCPLPGCLIGGRPASVEQNLKPRLLEMMVAGESLAEVLLAHGCKAQAVGHLPVFVAMPPAHCASGGRLGGERKHAHLFDNKEGGASAPVWSLPFPSGRHRPHTSLPREPRITLARWADVAMSLLHVQPYPHSCSRRAAIHPGR